MVVGVGCGSGRRGRCGSRGRECQWKESVVARGKCGGKRECGSERRV